MTCMDCDDHEDCERKYADLLKTLRAAEARNEVLCGVIRLRDGLERDRLEAMKRPVPVGRIRAFWRKWRL